MSGKKKFQIVAQELYKATFRAVRAAHNKWTLNDQHNSSFARGYKT